MPTEQAKDFAYVSYVHILSKTLEMVHLLLTLEPILVNLYAQYLLPNSPSHLSSLNLDLQGRNFLFYDCLINLSFYLLCLVCNMNLCSIMKEPYSKDNYYAWCIA